MFTKATVAATLTLAAVASAVCSVLPASAQNVSASGQSELRQNMDGIQNKINRCRTEGRLSSGDAASLQGRLDQCNSLFRAAIADGNINAQERANIQQNLNLLGSDNRLQTNFGNANGVNTTGSVNTNDRWNDDKQNWRGGGGISFNYITSRRQQLGDRITQLASSGRLTGREQSKLQRQLDQNATLEARFRASGGRVGNRERQSLMTDLDQLADQIRHESRDGQFARGRYGRNN